PPGPAGGQGFGISVNTGAEPGNLTPGPAFFGWQQGATGAPGPSGDIAIISIGPGPDGPQGGGIGYGVGPAGAFPPGQPGSPSLGSLQSPNELSDRLGQALGVSGDRVREAMRQMIGTLPPPVDPLS